jgi:hypothetical protein
LQQQFLILVYLWQQPKAIAQSPHIIAYDLKLAFDTCGVVFFKN